MGRVSEGLALVVAAAGLSLVLSGLLSRHEHLADFILFWLLSGGTTPFKRSPTLSRLPRIVAGWHQELCWALRVSSWYADGPQRGRVRLLPGPLGP